MTARAVEARSTPIPARVPGLASTAIHGRLTTPGTATILGTSSHAVWLLVDDSVIVVSTRDATRLPNGVEIAADAADEPFRGVHHGATVRIGFNRIMLEGLAVNVVRWWDPRPVLAPVTPSALAVSIAGLPATVPSVAATALRTALADASAQRLLAAARSLLGKGPGLTPESDDYLAGALAAIRSVGAAVNSKLAAAMLDKAAGPLAQLADARTTTFSAALIHNALRGQVAAPAGALLQAFAGRGDVATAHARLLRVGHSSGPALAAGSVLGAQSLVQYFAVRNGGTK